MVLRPAAVFKASWKNTSSRNSSLDRTVICPAHDKRDERIVFYGDLIRSAGLTKPPPYGITTALSIHPSREVARMEVTHSPSPAGCLGDGCGGNFLSGFFLRPTGILMSSTDCKPRLKRGLDGLIISGDAPKRKDPFGLAVAAAACFGGEPLLPRYRPRRNHSDRRRRRLEGG